MTLSTGQISIGQAVATDRNVTFNNVNVQGNCMTGTATKINSTNTDISDNLILLNSNLNVVNPNDSGILINRALDPSNNAFMGWDESADKFILGTTAANGNSIGDLNITPASLIVDDIISNDISAVNFYTTGGNFIGNVTENLTGTVVTATQNSITTMTGLTTTGTIGTGTWNASTISVQYGGPGRTDFGSAGQVLKVNSSENALEWGAAVDLSNCVVTNLGCKCCSF